MSNYGRICQIMTSLNLNSSAIVFKIPRTIIVNEKRLKLVTLISEKAVYYDRAYKC